MKGVQKMNIWLYQPTSNLFKCIFCCNFHQNILHYIYIYAFSRCFYPKRLTVHLQFLSVCVFPGTPLLHHVISQPFMRLLLYMLDRIVRLSVSGSFFACVREFPVTLLQRNIFLRIYKSAVFYKGFVLQSLESIVFFIRFSCMHQSQFVYDCALLILK